MFLVIYSVPVHDLQCMFLVNLSVHGDLHAVFLVICFVPRVSSVPI